jgi:diguanylate cyclase (GGDEF)-like protein
MSQLLERTLTQRSQQRSPCAIMLIDLDRFKQVNDTLGHAAGDALLMQVAARLLRVVGDKEKVSRLGGDEFQVILPGVEDRGVLGDLASRIITGISQPYTIDGSRCLIGASVGVAVSPFDGEDSDSLVRNADLALYAAKGGGGYIIVSAQGKNRYVVYDRAPPFAVRGVFAIGPSADGSVDGTSVTDGLDASPGALPGLPAGVLVVQDDANPVSEIDQNFKIVDWREIEAALTAAKAQ